MYIIPTQKNVVKYNVSLGNSVPVLQDDQWQLPGKLLPARYGAGARQEAAEFSPLPGLRDSSASHHPLTVASPVFEMSQILPES